MYASYQGISTRTLEWDDKVGVSFLYRGYLIDNETFSGIDNYYWNLTVSSGKTLTVSPGSTLRFATGKKLTCNGSLSAIGTSSSPILFTSNAGTPAAGDWQYVILKGGPNTLKYCTVDYSTYGFFINNTSTNTLENCAAHYSLNYGITAYNTSTNQLANQVKNCTIMVENSGGITIQNARLDLISTAVVINPGWGIVHWDGGLSFMQGCTITDNLNDGIWTYGTTSYARLSPDLGTTPGNNVVQDNDAENSSEHHQIIIIGGGAFLGDNIGGTQYGGNNTVKGNCDLIHNETATTVKAQYTHWPSCPPPCLYGSVDYANCLTPMATPLAAYTSGDAEENNAQHLSGTTDDADVRRMIVELQSRVTNGSIGEARDALGQLAGALASDVSWEPYLQTIVSSTTLSAKVRSLAQAFGVQARMNQRDYIGAISLASTILSGSPDDELWLFCESQIVCALAASGDIAGAEREYSAIRTRGEAINAVGTNHLLEVIGWERENQAALPVSGMYADQSRRKVGVPQSASLAQNFPNPFNPSTVLSYVLPEAGYVSLKVFNTLGQEVRELVGEIQEPGFKSVRFDATTLSSGIYFYRLQVGEFVETKMMLLMK